MKEINKQLLAELQDQHYQDMVKMGWGNPDIPDDHYLALIISELGEAIHAHQKGRRVKDGMLASVDFLVLRYRQEMRRFCSDPSAINEKYVFYQAFVAFIKDTVEDELADVLLRILCLAAMRDIRFDVFSHQELFDRFCKSRTFTQQCYSVMSCLTRQRTPIKIRFRMAISLLFAIADGMGFDLLDHAGMKRRFNTLRADWHQQKEYN